MDALGKRCISSNRQPSRMSQLDSISCRSCYKSMIEVVVLVKEHQLPVQLRAVNLVLVDIKDAAQGFSTSGSRLA